MNYVQNRIHEWVVNSFNTNLEIQMKKLKEEMEETLEAFESGETEDLAEELADMHIVICGIMGLLNKSLQKTTNKKMKQNIARKWAMNEEGVPHHVD